MNAIGRRETEEDHVSGDWSEPTADLRVYSASYEPALRVQIFGQRCSGTKVVSKFVAANFGPAAVTDRYGFNQWFVPDQVLFPGDVLAVVIGPKFDWIRSLHRQPWHAHPELKALGFSYFIRTEWHSYWDGEFAVIDPLHPMLNREMLNERDPTTGRPVGGYAMVATRIGATRIVEAESPARLALYGVPAMPEDLHDLPAVAVDGPMQDANWRFRH